MTGNKPPMTRDEIRELIDRFTVGVDEVVAAIGTDLKRKDEGLISDLGIAAHELEHVTLMLSRLSFKLGEI
jgi:hypothetical protein